MPRSAWHHRSIVLTKLVQYDDFTARPASTVHYALTYSPLHFWHPSDTLSFQYIPVPKVSHTLSSNHPAIHSLHVTNPVRKCAPLIVAKKTDHPRIAPHHVVHTPVVMQSPHLNLTHHLFNFAALIMPPPCRFATVSLVRTPAVIVNVRNNNARALPQPHLYRSTRRRFHLPRY